MMAATGVFDSKPNLKKIKKEAQFSFLTSPDGFETLNSSGDNKGMPAAPICVVSADHFGRWTLIAREAQT